MKPDKNTCLNCGKQVSSRAKYCSDKCTKAYKRKADKLGQKESPNSDISNSDTPNNTKSDKLRDSLTRTDKTYYDRAMKKWGEPYYNFDGTIREGVCGFCKAKFKTNLSLNKYCSYDHYSGSLKVLHD